MTKVLSSKPTAQEFANKWTQRFEKALNTVAKDGKVDTDTADKLGKLRGDGKVFADNVSNYLGRTGKDEIAVDALLGASRKFVLSQAKAVAGSDGKVSDTDALKMSSDLVGDFYVMRGRKAESTVPKARPTEVDAALKEVYNPDNDYSGVGDDVSNTKTLAWPIRKCIDDFNAIFGSDYPAAVREFKAGGEKMYMVIQDNDGGGGFDVFNAKGTWLVGMSCSESGEPNWSTAAGRLTDAKLKKLGLDG